VDVYELIRNATLARRQVVATYRGYRRELCPHVLGTKHGHRQALVFQFGGESRADKARRVELTHGDVVVWGGAARLRYHGVMPLKDGDHPLVGAYRINLTFRKAG